jgi:hypothetical protein
MLNLQDKPYMPALQLLHYMFQLHTQNMRMTNLFQSNHTQRYIHTKTQPTILNLQDKPYM